MKLAMTPAIRPTTSQAMMPTVLSSLGARGPSGAEPSARRGPLSASEDCRQLPARLIAQLGGEVGATDGALGVVEDPERVDRREVGEDAQVHDLEHRL